jgi:hypothetical protein
MDNSGFHLLMSPSFSSVVPATDFMAYAALIIHPMVSGHPLRNSPARDERAIATAVSDNASTVATCPLSRPASGGKVTRYWLHHARIRQFADTGPATGNRFSKRNRVFEKKCL